MIPSMTEAVKFLTFRMLSFKFYDFWGYGHAKLKMRGCRHGTTTWYKSEVREGKQEWGRKKEGEWKEREREKKKDGAHSRSN